MRGGLLILVGLVVVLMGACGTPKIVSQQPSGHEAEAHPTRTDPPPTLPTPAPPPTTAAQAPVSNNDGPPIGDPVRGEALYRVSINGAQSCISCHLLTDEDYTGPGLGGYARVAGDRVAGESATDYTYNSIVRPADYILPGYSNVMPTGYRFRLTEQEMADIVAFLLTLN